jgi:hypothetical protein
MSRLLTCPWFGWISDEGAQFTEIIRAHDCQSPIEGPEDANEAESDQAVQKEFGLDVGCHIPSVSENMKYEVFKYGLTPILSFSDFTLFKLH